METKVLLEPRKLIDENSLSILYLFSSVQTENKRVFLISWKLMRNFRSVLVLSRLT